jgi:N6-adenosine-specific RNA methylase IME4
MRTTIASSGAVELLALTDLHAHPSAGLVPAMGDGQFAAFCADVAERGVLAPLDIDSKNGVLDGRERVRAGRELGLERLPVRRVEPEHPARYMLLAALRRRDLGESQRAALQLELLNLDAARERATANSRANLRRDVERATLPAPAGRLRDQLAEQAGVSARTAQDVLTVKQEDPVLFEQVKAGLPAHRAASEVRRARRYSQIGKAPPLPEGPFDLVYADPPWQLGNPGGRYAPEQHYPTMPIEQIAAMQMPAADDAVLFLWAVNSLLPEALQVMGDWGFTYKAQLVWVKPSIKLGNYFRNRHELLLFGRKGNYPLPGPKERIDSVIEAACGRHSAKPPVVYELIERSYPAAAKLELFRRGKPHPGWAAWGNEVTP